LVEDQDRTALVLLGEDCNNIFARLGEIDVADIELVSEFWKISHHTGDLGAIRTVVRGTLPVGKVFFEQKQCISGHGWLLLNEGFGIL
jgi:hypothetical protein